MGENLSPASPVTSCGALSCYLQAGDLSAPSLSLCSLLTEQSVGGFTPRGGCHERASGAGAHSQSGRQPARHTAQQKHDITERRRMEEALKESEEKFRVLTEASPAAVLVYRGGKHLDVNRAAEEIFGYSKEELLTRWDPPKESFGPLGQNARCGL